MNIKSLKTQFIGAIAMVLVAAIAMGSSTYAWFAINQKVTATGMVVKTNVSDNLLIADTAVTSTAKETDDKFQTNYLKPINAILEPVSAIDGVNFFYTKTNNVNAKGDAISDNYIAYAANDAFDENYGFTNNGLQDAVGYVDYAFQLKAVNSSSAARNVDMTKVEFLYNGTQDADTNTNPDTTEKAFRVAIFVDDMGDDGTSAASGTQSSSNLLSILRESGATYFTGTNAVNTTTTLAAVDGKIDDPVRIGTLNAGQTHFYKVVVRLWLEGEDQTCNNTTFAKLTSDWAMNLDIELSGSTSGVTNITKTQNTSASAIPVDLTAVGVTVVDSTPIVIDGETYYEITGANLTNISNLGAGAKICTADTELYSDSVIYKLIEGRYLNDITNQCTLPATARPAAP